MRLHLSLITAAVAMALAPAANAAKPFEIGSPGAHPDVAVDENGTAHVVWDQDSGSTDKPDTLHYCQVTLGARACSGEKELPAPLEAIGRTTYVFTVSTGRVIVESYRCCDSEGNTGNYVFESTDGGRTFGPARKIGNIDHQESAVFGPGETISGSSISTYQQMPLAGSSLKSTDDAEFDAGFPVPTHSGMALFNGTQPVQVMSDGDDTSFVRYQSGDPNSASSWSTATDLTPTGDEPRLAGGPKGLVMLYTTGTPGNFTLSARVFDGTNFGAPVKVSETGDPIFADLALDPISGRFHAFWVANGVSPNELRWSYSDDGTNWSPPQTVVRGGDGENAFNLQVAAGPDGTGVGVWDQNDRSGHVRAVQLDPGADGSADTPADSVEVGGQEISLLTPGGQCVNPGVKIAVRITSKVKKLLSPKKRVKIVHVDFFLDKKHVRDKKAAFKAFFKTKGLKPGKHKLRANVLLKPVLAKGPKKLKKLKKLKGTLTICG